MSKRKLKKRWLDHWKFERLFGVLVIHGFERYAGRWITEKVLWWTGGYVDRSRMIVSTGDKKVERRYVLGKPSVNPYPDL